MYIGKQVSKEIGLFLIAVDNKKFKDLEVLWRELDTNTFIAPFVCRNEESALYWTKKLVEEFKQQFDTIDRFDISECFADACYYTIENIISGDEYREFYKK